MASVRTLVRRRGEDGVGDAHSAGSRTLRANVRAFSFFFSLEGRCSLSAADRA
jgi:hypothetical protein